MNKIFISIAIFVNFVYGGMLGSDAPYLEYKAKNYTIIYIPKYQNEAKFIKKNLDKFFIENEIGFGFTLDSPLKIVLVSDDIEIANAFSTQTPYNLNAYFSGGITKIDYFGNKKITGKNLAEDFSEGKLTLPLIHAMKVVKNSEKKLIQNALMQYWYQSHYLILVLEYRHESLL